MQVLQVQMEVRPDPAEVSRARRWARSRLVGSGIGADEPLADTLILLISELVTNAVVHTGCPAVLRMLFPAQSAGSGGNGGGGNGGGGNGGGGGGASGPFAGRGPGLGTVRVEVADASDRAPRQRCAAEGDTHGRGLELVDGLADRWGWQPEGAGKRIWCEIDRAKGEEPLSRRRAASPAASHLGRTRQSPDQVLT
ncbi:ATP-binding protein [Streptomyces hygroscopicus subsp. sporocinereus]|uniref:ATP-binding protein n=1 Tax=Streptomyces hygroscopicus TaxID=1912 RepID=A0ABQ3U4X6_STRHY|nr:ATP-binding protein [Streptomyces hygroscopicus]GHJ30660.1 ATP-binding protein [Streptomyces hygroscopicus]